MSWVLYGLLMVGAVGTIAALCAAHARQKMRIKQYKRNQQENEKINQIIFANQQRNRDELLERLRTPRGH